MIIWQIEIFCIVIVVIFIRSGHEKCQIKMPMMILFNRKKILLEKQKLYAILVSDVENLKSKINLEPLLPTTPTESHLKNRVNMKILIKTRNLKSNVKILIAKFIRRN